jgi:hypothetical protein
MGLGRYGFSHVSLCLLKTKLLNDYYPKGSCHWELVSRDLDQNAPNHTIPNGRILSLFIIGQIWSFLYLFGIQLPEIQ